MSVAAAARQASVDSYHAKNGPCCAGCDFWRWINSCVGECVRHAPDPSHDAAGGLGIEGWSGQPSSTMLTMPEWGADEVAVAIDRLYRGSKE